MTDDDDDDDDDDDGDNDKKLLTTISIYTYIYIYTYTDTFMHRVLAGEDATITVVISHWSTMRWCSYCCALEMKQSWK